MTQQILHSWHTQIVNVDETYQLPLALLLFKGFRVILHSLMWKCLLDSCLLMICGYWSSLQDNLSSGGLKPTCTTETLVRKRFRSKFRPLASLNASAYTFIGSFCAHWISVMTHYVANPFFASLLSIYTS